MRRLALLFGAITASLIVAACGGSSAPAHHKAKKKKHATTHHHVLAASPATIATAARKSAAEPGYAVSVNLSLDSAQLNGTTSANGSGVFDAQGGNLDLTLRLPGIYALLNPLRTTAVLANGTAYVRVPGHIAAALPKIRPWLAVNLASAAQELGISVSALTGALTPHAVLDALVAHSSGHVTALGTDYIDGDTVKKFRETVSLLGSTGTIYVWIDPNTDLLSQVSFSYSSQGGINQVGARITFDGYGKQTLLSVPSPSRTGTLGSALKALSE